MILLQRPVINTVITPYHSPFFMERPTYALFLSDNYDASKFECHCENKDNHFICYPCLFGVNDSEVIERGF